MPARSPFLPSLAALLLLSTACGDDKSDDREPSEDAGQSTADASTPDASADASASRNEAGVVTNADITIAPALADGQVIAPWDKYCVATFTRDFAVMSVFGDTKILDIQAGDRYLLAADTLGLREQIIYITDQGATDLEIEYESARPYNSSCDGEEALFAVFADATLYEDEAFTKPVCELQAGQVLPKARGHSISLANNGYAVEISTLGSVCGGISKGYVKTSRITIPGGGGYTGIPFLQIASPT